MSVPAYCPHCLSALPPSAPAMARCAACRLMVGPGRALTKAQARRSSVPVSASSGLLRNNALRADHAPGDPDQVLSALCRAAEHVGCRVERLRLADYQELCQADPAFPSAAEVLATYPRWKDARVEAGLKAAAT